MPPGLRGGWCALLTVALCGSIAACAPMVASAPVAFRAEPATAPRTEFVINRSVEIFLPTRYYRTLPAQSRWRRVGSIVQGDVYRPLDTVFTLEGRHVHEAYLVVSGNVLRGFYLAAESSFSALSPEVTLPTGDPQ